MAISTKAIVIGALRRARCRAHFRTFRTTGNHSAGVFLIPQSLDVGTAIDELVLIWLASEASEWQDRLEWLLQYRQELGYPGRGDVPNLVEVHSDVIHCAMRTRDSAETCLAASPITPTFRMTASCNSSDAMNAARPGSMKRVIRRQRSSMWCRYSRSSFTEPLPREGFGRARTNEATSRSRHGP